MLPKITATPADRAAIVRVLEQLGSDVCDVLSHAGGRIVVVKPKQEYCEASPLLRKRFIYDPWPTSPGAIFVQDEMTAYVRTVTHMTVAHELMHMVDRALGKHEYRSTHDYAIERAYQSAVAFVTPAGVANKEEFWAEHARAWFEINDTDSFWPAVSRERLRAVNVPMYAIVEKTFEQTIPTLATEVRAVRAARRARAQVWKSASVAA